ncbi:zinc-dependent metalloprotease [Azohydromonas australica]|uniref:zinc-dependent metalloprotease n=1 Tax=Azohydromonas australica TaxID=364039 RepID=UPI000401C93F|nr:zinc-dependent metalloprotease [Azohydromonas australica]
MSSRRSPSLLSRALAPALLPLLLGGCASVQVPQFLQSLVPFASGSPSSSELTAKPPGAPLAAPSTPPGALQPFANVIRGARRTEGLITLWQKDDKVWLELDPEDFNRPFFLAPKIAQGLGEGGVLGGLMVQRNGKVGRAQIVEFRRVHNQVQMVAKNPEYVAREGTPQARAVEAGFAQSLLASSAVASQPHPERKSVLVEANPLFLVDLLGLSQSLQRAYRQGYALDTRHTGFTSVRSTPEQVVFNVQAHFATATIASATPGAPPGAPQPSAPDTLPDARSMFLGLYYSLAKLPEAPMKPRKADPRVGHFTTVVQDFSDDLARTPRQRFVNRWRLEKQDPAAALSEPVKPITFWLDRTIPEKYRDAISRGILAWNAAFEPLGFKNAIRVQVQPEGADFDTFDVGYPSVRWMTNAEASFGAIGPSQVDPRTGEILDADISFESLSSRAIRTLRSQVLNSKLGLEWPALMQSGPGPDAQMSPARREAGGVQTALSHAAGDACQHAEVAAEQLGYALDVLEARGELDPASPEAQRFVLDYLTDTAMHEVGHTLGLRHNFRASRLYTDAQLSDPEFTRTHSLTGSVMEYAPINLPRNGQKGGTPFQTKLGPYDYWAIEYAYKTFPPGTSAKEEEAQLARIAARSSEPGLSFGTDEDNYLGVDPETLMFDLSSDVLEFAGKRMEIARELLQRLETRPLKPDEDYAVLRRAVLYAVRDAGRAAGLVARQIGGVRTLRDFPGSGRDPLQPVPAATQRAALELLVAQVLSPEGLRVSPTLQRRLAPDFQERGEALSAGAGSVSTDFSIAPMVIGMQRALLAQLMSDDVAQRLLDSEGKFARTQDAFHLSELYGRLTREVWRELSGRGDIPAMRRELQREHVNRLAQQLLRPQSLSRADARALVRAEALALLPRLQAAAKRGDLSPEARAHLLDSADTLQAALSARLERAGA